MFCEKCGKQIDENDKFCTHCGKPAGEIKKNKIEETETLNVDRQSSMDEEIIQKKENDYSQAATIFELKEPISFWKWYFGWHPRMLLTIPAFLLFCYSIIWFIVAGIQDLIIFFQTHTWAAVGVALVLGSFLFIALAAPVYISFLCMVWLYELNIGGYSAWKKFFGSMGLLLLVTFGTVLVRYIVHLILGI